MTVTAKEIQHISEFWGVLFPDTDSPSPQQWALWSLMHDAATIRKGLVQLSAKHRNLNGQMDSSHMARFLSAVLNRLSGEVKSQQPTKAVYAQ